MDVCIFVPGKARPKIRLHCKNLPSAALHNKKRAAREWLTYVLRTTPANPPRAESYGGP